METITNLRQDNYYTKFYSSIAWAKVLGSVSQPVGCGLIYCSQN
jgi:hypothetical protein